MADRIAIMNDGTLQQVGGPTEVYAHPANLFVAQFVGSPIMNVADCRVETAGTTVSIWFNGAPAAFPFGPEIPGRIASADPGDLTLGVRPEAVLVERTPQPGYVPAQLRLVEPQGAYDILDLTIGTTVLRARTTSRFVTGLHEPVWVKLDQERTHFFDKKSGLALRTLP